MTRIQKSQMRLSDLGAILRPSMAQSKYHTAQDQFNQLWPRLPKVLHRSSDHHSADFAKLARRFVPNPRGHNPCINLVARKIRDSQDAFAQASKSLARAAGLDISQRHKQLIALERLRETLGYKATINRGYAVVRSGDKVITTRKDAKFTDTLEIEFRDGRFDLAGMSNPSLKAKKGVSSSDQGSLF